MRALKSSFLRRCDRQLSRASILVFAGGSLRFQDEMDLRYLSSFAALLVGKEALYLGSRIKPLPRLTKQLPPRLEAGLSQALV